MKKAKDVIVTRDYLQLRCVSGFEPAKWVQFCAQMLDRGLTVMLYEARQTKSKYVTVIHGTKSFKVRFSDHPPSRFREYHQHCDFFVGRNNFSTTTTAQAAMATLSHLGLPWDEPDTNELHRMLY